MVIKEKKREQRLGMNLGAHRADCREEKVFINGIHLPNGIQSPILSTTTSRARFTSMSTGAAEFRSPLRAWRLSGGRRFLFFVQKGLFVQKCFFYFVDVSLDRLAKKRDSTIIFLVNAEGF